jgi:hypothetical protein
LLVLVLLPEQALRVSAAAATLAAASVKRGGRDRLNILHLGLLK